MNGELKGLFIGSLFLLMVSIAACSANQDVQLSGQDTDAAASGRPVSDEKETLKISFQEALAIAEDQVEGTTFAIEREIEDNIPVIEVELGDYEILVNAQTGDVIEIENIRESDDDDDIEELNEALELQQYATITILDALESAESFAGGEAHTVELENEEGNLVYEVVIGLDEVYVDAGTGAVLFTETTDSEDEAQPKSSIQVPFDEADDD